VKAVLKLSYKLKRFIFEPQQDRISGQGLNNKEKLKRFKKEETT
jgi:hypothetical protein